MAHEEKLTIKEYAELYPETWDAMVTLDAAMAAVGKNYPNSQHALACLKALRAEFKIIEFSNETDAFKSADVKALIARCKGLEKYLVAQAALHAQSDPNKPMCLKLQIAGVDHNGACLLDTKEGIMLTHAPDGPSYVRLTCKNIRVAGQTCADTVVAMVKLMKLKPCDVHPELFKRWGYEVIENPNV